MKEEEKTEEINEDLETRLYELSFLILPLVDEGEIESETDKIKKNIEDSNAKILSAGETEKIELSYEMSKKIDNSNKKFSSAFFGWIRFEADPYSLDKIKEEIDKNKNILRHLLILVDKDSFIDQKEDTSKKVKKTENKLTKTEKKSQKTEQKNKEEKVKKIISKEDIKEIDKTIDNLVEGSEFVADKARSSE